MVVWRDAGVTPPGATCKPSQPRTGVNLPIQPLGAAPGSRYRTATAAGSCTLFSACLVPLGSQAALPTSQAYSSGETKVIINAGDSADDHDTDGKPAPGTSSASSTGSRSYVFTSDALTGYNGNASASATDP